MVEGFEQTTQTQISLLNDINMCLNAPRIDKMMYMFVHIYEQVEESQMDGTNMKIIKADINKILKNKDFMSTIELYYKVSEGEEGRLLFDPSVQDEAVYNLDNYVAEQGKEKVDVFLYMIELKRRIAEDLGRIKKKMLVGAGLDMKF